MNHEQFAVVFEKISKQSRETLLKKAEEYASDEDRLHNFHVAAIFEGVSPPQALWGMATKHFVSISDMVRTEGVYSRARWDEKIGDAINYLILLRALIEEEATRETDSDGTPSFDELIEHAGPTKGDTVSLAISEYSPNKRS